LHPPKDTMDDPDESAEEIEPPFDEPDDRAEVLTQQVASLEEKVKRIQAEFLNETKRIRQQAETDRAYAIQKVVVDLLPLADALHGAAASLGEKPEGAGIKEGIDMVARQFDEVLARHGVGRIDAAGKPFDPALHEALMVVPRSDVPPQTVLEVVRPGFTLNGRVVRPAHVLVSAPVSPGASA
jgi:molecular chaperone GrpE